MSLEKPAPAEKISLGEAVNDAQEQVESKREQRELQLDRQLIADLKQRNREVSDHEQAYKAVGGQYAGAMLLDYEHDSDGVNYAVAGEVQINLSRSADIPKADLIIAQQVRQTALSPADPSTQDKLVAAT